MRETSLISTESIVARIKTLSKPPKTRKDEEPDKLHFHRRNERYYRRFRFLGRHTSPTEAGSVLPCINYNVRRRHGTLKKNTAKSSKERINYSLRRGEIGLGFRASAIVAANPSESLHSKTIFSATFIA